MKNAKNLETVLGKLLKDNLSAVDYKNVSAIFKDTKDSEEAYYRILDYLEEKNLNKLLQEVEMYYITK
ncbi:hypothetical protein HZC20_03670 [Candidatus Peregrinibacteria bacterium]|nr:hypothetical protein [Candidatus Peregrinibacteria bacterium]